MSYEYQAERPKLFTPDGVDLVFKIRDNAQRLLKASGAFMTDHAFSGVTGDSWTMLAALDYLVERGEIKKVSTAGWAQHHVYVSGRTAR